MDPTIIIVLAVMMAFLWWMSRNAKKQQQRLNDERDAAIVVGANVVTRSGFLGTIVDIDGDAVTLESPSGIETVWLRSSIVQVMDIPWAEISEEEAEAQDAESEISGNEASVDSEQTDGSTVAENSSGDTAQTSKCE